MSDLIRRSIKELLAGVDGVEIAERLRQHYANAPCLNGQLSKVRKGYLAAAARPPEYAAKAEELLQKGSALAKDDFEELQRFMGLALSAQYYAQKKHRKHKWTLHDSLVDELVDALPLVPANFKTLRITAAEVKQCDDAKRAQVEAKNSELRVHDNPGEMLRAMREQVRVAGESTSNRTALGAALIGLSGRRFIEIFNCRSQFLPVGGHAHLALFHGQAKKREDGAAPPYPIPLLVPQAEFARAFDVFKRLQRTNAARTGNAPPAERANDEIEGQNHALRTWLTRTDRRGRRMRPEYRCLDNVKNFREIYLQYVKHCFATTGSDNHLSKMVHGHEGIETSLAYVNYDQRWEETPPRLGTFPAHAAAASSVASSEAGAASEAASEAGAASEAAASEASRQLVKLPNNQASQINLGELQAQLEKHGLRLNGTLAFNLLLQKGP